jgi:protein-disulfide isomerase
MLPILTWYGIKPYLLNAKDFNLYKNAYKRLQNNPEVFNSLLAQQSKAADNWQNLGVNIGNPDAPNTIIKVCSIFCTPCAEAFPKLEEIINLNKNVNLKIIFTTHYNESDRSLPFVRHLLSIAAQNDNLKMQQVFKDWYLSPNKNYEEFAAKYPVNYELRQHDSHIEAMSTWCNKAGITHTPTIFVNGHQLPENYEIENLRYILK